MPLPGEEYLSPTTSKALVRIASGLQVPSVTPATVLRNLDILFVIFDGNRGPQGVLTNSDLAHCARVSRAFNEAALRALWRNLPTLLPLWHILAPPGLGFPDKHYANAAYFQKIEGASLHKDPVYLSRLLAYARHVRSINLNTMWPTRHVKMLQLVLEECGASQALFPCLQSIQLSSVASSTLPLVKLFTQSLCILIAVVGESEATERADGLDAMHNIAVAIGSGKDMSSRLRCLTIERDSVRVDHPLNDAARLLLHNISSLRHLQSVTLRLPCGIPAYTLLALAARPALTYLKLDNVISDTNDRPLPSRNTVTSPRLHVFELEGTSAGLIAALECLYIPELRSLKVVVADPASAPDLSSCTAAIARAVNPDVLCQLSVVLGSDCEPQSSARWTHILRPCMTLHALVRFKLASESVLFAASDAEFADLFGECQWTRLERFDGEDTMWLDDNATPSSSLLRHFRKSCPSLRDLALPYLRPTLESTTSPEALDSSIGLHGLRTLHIGNTHYQSAERAFSEGLANDVAMSLARYIHRLFPMLKLGKERWGSSTECPEWMSVFCALQSLVGSPSS